MDFQFSIKNENLEDYIYQLVVIATTKIKHEIDFELGFEHDGKSLLSELKVKRMYESVNGEQVLIPLSKDNYICSRQITQADINSGEVELKLQRMVGQLILILENMAKTVLLFWILNTVLPLTEYIISLFQFTILLNRLPGLVKVKVWLLLPRR